MRPGASVSLQARLALRRGDFSLEVELDVAEGETVALLGPNGAGKSSTLRTLAGLVALEAGRLELDGTVLDDPVTGVLVPPERRSVGLVFQDYLLFPHLSCLENVAFGLRARGTHRHDARARAQAWLDRVGLPSYASARPGSLSGGQAQRVALARALVTEPRLLLLDEPLAALDAGTRSEVRADLRRHLQAYDGSALVVTHDALDAMVLADRIVVLEGGRVVQQGTPAEVARAPRTDYVAALVGLNLHRGHGRDGAVVLDGGGELHASTPARGEVLVAYRPSAVALHTSRPEHSSPRNVWPGRVRGLEQHADSVRVQVDGRPPVLADVTAAAAAELALVPGVQVWVSVKASEVTAYPADGTPAGVDGPVPPALPRVGG